GYSSGDQFVFSTSVVERNLFGKGQSLSATFDVGTARQDFVVSFTEPYLYDSPLTVGFDAFNTEREFTDFDSRKTGLAMRTSYPFKRLVFPFVKRWKKDPANEEAYDQPVSMLDYMRGGMSYELTREKIDNIDSDAPIVIQDEEGKSLTSSVTPNLSYDSRDHFFTPTEGTSSGLSFKFAGLGGDSRFIKSDARARWYYSFLKDPNWGGTYTVALGGNLGYGVGLAERDNGKKNLPLFERYFPGGINSVRGFRERSLGPRAKSDCDSSSPPVCASTEVVGGDKQAILNVELMFPVAEQYGILGVAFFDMGQAFSDSESISFGQFRRSVGFGGRWLSPFGPLRVELGFPLNKQPDDETSVLGFSLGAQP
ncbi:MAG: BamA/TamA family outer membrane protein, partial [Candidatus Binatia bacterium]